MIDYVRAATTMMTGSIPDVLRVRTPLCPYLLILYPHSLSLLPIVH